MDSFLDFLAFACKLVDNCSAEENIRKTRVEQITITRVDIALAFAATRLRLTLYIYIFFLVVVVG